MGRSDIYVKQGVQRFIANVSGRADGIQLQANIDSLGVTLSAEQMGRLDEASNPGGLFFSADLKRMIFGGHSVKEWR